MIKQFLRFCVVGTIGFLADSITLMVLTQYGRVDPYSGRLLSFLLAATVTWYLNRVLTFRNRRGSGIKQWFIYVLVTSVGAGVNIGAYSIWIQMTDHSPENLLIGVAIGSIVALFVNFFASKLIVFSKPKLKIRNNQADLTYIKSSQNKRRHHRSKNKL